jgi:amino acid transporter
VSKAGEEKSSGNNQLRRTLSLFGAIAISIGLMAPSMAANITPQATAGIVGRAVPLAFVLALVTVLFVAHSFVRLTQHFNHAGSAYGFVGATLGPRAGVVAGWALFGTYVLFAVITAAASGIFTATFLGDVGIWHNPPGWAPFAIIPFVLVLVWAFALISARGATQAVLIFEGATVALIVVVAVIVLVKVIAHQTPAGQHFTLSVFEPEPGTSFGTIFQGAIFGFLAFAGFEAAGTLGEETRDPRRNIPRAILGVVILGGIYFVFVTAVEVLGFGTGTKGVTAFVSSGSLLGDLSTLYVGSPLGDIITAGTAISAFACALASTVGATRLAYAFGRDGFGPAALSRTSRRTDTPTVALALVAALTVIVIYALRLGGVSDAFDIFAWGGTIGTLTLLVAYALAALGVARLYASGRQRRGHRWEAVIPVVALVLIGFTVYYNLEFTTDSGPGFWNPVIAGIWIVAGIVIVVALPGVARRIGARLAQDEGLSAAGETADSGSRAHLGAGQDLGAGQEGVVTE